MEDANIRFGEITNCKFDDTTNEEFRMDVFVDEMCIGFLSAPVYQENGKRRAGLYVFYMGAESEMFYDLGKHANLWETKKALKEMLSDSNNQSHGDIWGKIVDNWKILTQDAADIVDTMKHRAGFGDADSRNQLPLEQERLNSLNRVYNKYNAAQQER